VPGTIASSPTVIDPVSEAPWSRRRRVQVPFGFVRPEKAAVITEAWPVKSMITHPAPNAVFKVGKPLLIEGRAWVGEGAIDRVDLSFNEGVSWQAAAINSGGDKYAWRVFSLEFQPKTSGYTTVLARARDDKGNVQPIVSTWNPLGYFWNGIHRVGFVVEA